MLGDTGNRQAVRILLECILVLVLFSVSVNAYVVRIQSAETVNEMLAQSIELHQLWCRKCSVTHRSCVCHESNSSVKLPRTNVFTVCVSRRKGKIKSFREKNSNTLSNEKDL